MRGIPPNLEFTKIRDLVVKSRLINTAAVDELSRRLIRGEYCLVLGPRFCEKTFLLEDIQSRLNEERGLLPLLVDLGDFRHDAGDVFIDHFAAKIAEKAHIVSDSPPCQERELHQFLIDLARVAGRHVVLLLDHLELLPVDDIIILLRVLRTVFTEQRPHIDAPRLTCVLASSFSVADLIFDPNSPFNEGFRTWVGDLDRDESHQLVSNIAEALGVMIEDGFVETLFELTNGDRYLIALLCNCCARIARDEGKDKLRLHDLETAEEWFLENVANYPPIQETMRVLEQEPDTLRAFMQVVQSDIPISERELEIRADQKPDVLRLTGGVRVIDNDLTLYQVRNELYRRPLTRYFHAARVARVFFMAGRFDDAITYLDSQNGLRTKKSLRTALLDAIVSNMYVARSIGEAVSRLAERIVSAFDIESAVVYIVSADRAQLDPISKFGRNAFPMALKNKSIPAAAFHDGHYKMQHDRARLTIPLVGRDGRRVGVLDIFGYDGDAQSEDFGALLTFSRQLGWAIANVVEHARRMEQLRILGESGQEISRSLDLDRVLESIIDAGTRAVPGAQRGLVLLYDETKNVLRVQKQKGYRPTFADEVQLQPGQGYVGTVFKNAEIMLLNDAQNDPRVLLRNDEDVRKQKSVLCVPLLGWGRTIGVFVVDNITEKHAFQPDDITIVSAFAAQAAAALQNAMVYRELYELSLEVNRGDLDREQIFRRAVASIVHVTGATAANMLLLRDTDDPDIAVSRPPIDSIAYRMADSLEENDEFERKVRPRPKGMTYEALRTRKPCICTSPDEPPGIHELSVAQGVRSSIALPLMLQDQPLGVLFVHFREPQKFSDEEVKVLSIFANLCAKAIEIAQHAEQLRVHASVAWMGLDLSDMSHSVLQAIPPIRTGLSSLASFVDGNQEALRVVEETQVAVDQIAALPKRPVLPREEDIRAEDLTALAKREILEWCKAHENIELDLTGIGDAPVYVRCDPRRLAKVLKSLTQNAVRAANQSSKPRIAAALTMNKRSVEITLTNSGPEIDPEIRDFLFKRPVPSSGQGQGVGLLIARSIVIGYGGDMELLGSGPDETSFRFSMPTERA